MRISSLLADVSSVSYKTTWAVGKVPNLRPLLQNEENVAENVIKKLFNKKGEWVWNLSYICENDTYNMYIQYVHSHKVRWKNVWNFDFSPKSFTAENIHPTIGRLRRKLLISDYLQENVVFSRSTSAWYIGRPKGKQKVCYLCDVTTDLLRFA